MVKEIWRQGKPQKNQKQLGNTFQVDFLLEIIDNLNMGRLHCFNLPLQRLISLDSTQPSLRISMITQGKAIEGAVIQGKTESQL